MTDTIAVRALIKAKGLKLSYIAKQLGISPRALTLKIENRYPFTVTEVAKLCDILDIKSLKERDKLFFTKKVEHYAT